MTGFASFAIGALLLVALTIVFLVWPFRRRPAHADLSRQQLNAAIYRDQFAELDRDLAGGNLSQADYDQAKAELQRRLLEDSEAEAGQVVAATPAGRALPIALATFLPLAAVGLYFVLGNPAALNPAASTAAHRQQFTQQDIERMVAGLAAKLESEPENHQGWAMLARSYKAMGRYPEAARAYERATPIIEGNANLLVDYADTLAAVNGFDARTMEIIDRALKLEPKQPQALWLRGTAAYEGKRYDRAIADWETLLQLFPAESEEAGIIGGNIAEARDLKAGKTAPK